MAVGTLRVSVCERERDRERERERVMEMLVGRKTGGRERGEG